MTLEESLEATKAQYQEEHLGMGVELWDDLPNWAKRDWIDHYGYIDGWENWPEKWSRKNEAANNSDG